MPTRYLLHLFIAALATLAITLLFALKGSAINYFAVVMGYLYGVVMMSMVIIRLPVFKGYYGYDIYSLERKRRSLAEAKAAPVMSSIVTVLTFGAIIYVTDISNAGVAVIGSGMTTSIMSYYFEEAYNRLG